MACNLSYTQPRQPMKLLRCCLLTVVICVTIISARGGTATAIGSAYEQGLVVSEDHARAAEWYEIGARQGDPMAAYLLGSDYYEGDGVKADPHMAFHWWQIAAEHGMSDAQAVLGDAYCLGIGVRPDGGEARRWWHLAARQNNEHASEMLRDDNCNGKLHSHRNRRSPSI